MKIIIYGNPYNINEYYFLKESDIYKLFKLYNINMYRYIDGAFSIIIADNNITYIFTDWYGYYPLFYDIKTKQIFEKIEKVNNINKCYLNTILCKEHNLTHTILPENIQSIIDLKNYNHTLFSFIHLIEPRAVTVIKNGKIDVIRYSTIKYMLNPIIEFIQIITNFIKNEYFNTIVCPVTGGYDSRNLYYFFKKNHINALFYTYYPEENFVLTNFDNDIRILENPYQEEIYVNRIKTHITDLNGMSDIYYYACHFDVIDNLIDENTLFITSDGANEYIEGSKYQHFIENAGHGHIVKLYNKAKYLPIFSNQKILSNINNRKEYMTSLTKLFTDKKQTYYNGLTNTTSIFNFFKNKHFNTMYNYIQEYIKLID